ncbi:Rv3654c family TadE-like protein [Streptomyces sp. 840.1]|uniref:Rv3654c family TadE-like protein n=1 Tax=Streptomyces sp. 840.1 TaxID=2485152 RepID=UPI000F46D398|nr:Rv3654c family TadE-like protein [Streptomyces sp. 840.1]
MRAGRRVPDVWLQGLCARYRGRERRDRGLATVWAAVATVTLCTVFAVVLALGQVVVARHRAGGAADLAALAAADRALDGATAACRAAQQVAGAQGAQVVRCAVQGEIADVVARVRVGPYAPKVRSRAGPATAVPVATGPSGGPERSASPGSPEGRAVRGARIAREVPIGGAR